MIKSLLTASEPQQLQCPACKDSAYLIVDKDAGEQLCSRCGVVVSDKMETIDGDMLPTEAGIKERGNHGLPRTLLYDSSSTVISTAERDVNGGSISSDTRMHRLKLMDHRIKSGNRNRSRIRGNREIQRMIDALGLGSQAMEKAGYYYKKAMEKKLIKGRSVNAIASACIYLVSRECGTFRSAGEIASSFHDESINEYDVVRAARLIENALGIRFQPVSPTTLINRYATTLNLSEKTKRSAFEILVKIKSVPTMSGKNPVAIASAALYLAARINNEWIPQVQFADMCDISVVSLRKRTKDLLDILGVQVEV